MVGCSRSMTRPSLMPRSQTILSAEVSKAGTKASGIRIRRVLCSLGIALGGVYAYSLRFAMSPDGIGYLDVARAYVRHDWTTAINGWWSPAYSWILAVFLSGFSPTSRTEYPLLHLVNFLCFAFASWSFHRFWQSLLISIEESNAELAGLPALAPLVFDLFGYSLFFFLFLPLIFLPTPDILASAFVFLIGERLLRCESRGSFSLRDGATLGFLFALAYLAKAIFLYFSIAVLVMAIFDRRTRRPRVLLLSALVLVSMIAPWAVALHHTFGEWTLGFTGRLNYAWFVDGTETRTFLLPAGAPLPYFPGKRVFSQPAIYQVQTQPNITYVPWYDPGRFDKSDHARFQWRGQIDAIEKNLVWLRDWFCLRLGPISVVVLALFLGSGAAGRRAFARYSVIALPALLVFAMYLLVFIRTPRYVVAVTIVLLAVVLASARLPRTNAAGVRAILVSGLIVFTLTNLPGLIDTFAALPNRNLDPTVEVAEALAQSGIQANSQVGTVGDAIFAFWAHLARVNIAAEIWNDDAPLFWGADSARRNEMLCVMGKSGASVVIAPPPPGADVNGWVPLGQSGYWMYRISPQRCGSN